VEVERMQAGRIGSGAAAAAALLLLASSLAAAAHHTAELTATRLPQGCRLVRSTGLHIARSRICPVPGGYRLGTGYALIRSAEPVPPLNATAGASG